MNRFEPPPLPGENRPAQEPQNPYASPTAGGPTPSSQDYRSSPSYGGPGAYGAAPQAPWGMPASYAHPRGTTVLVLGILSIVLLPLLGPFAWAMGRKAIREVDAAPHPTSNRSTLQAGMILGIIGTVLFALGVLWFIIVIGLFGLAVSAPL